MTTARVLEPVTITDAKYTACSVAEPDPNAVLPDGTVGEVAWVTGTTYTKGAYVIDTVSHRVYQDGAGGVSNKAPRLDPTRWGTGTRPTNKWAWADYYKSTRTLATDTIEITIRPGAVADVSLLGLMNVELVRVEEWDAPSGTKVYDQTVSGLGWGGDLWVSYYLDVPFLRDRIDFTGLLMHVTSEIKITISGDGQVGVGIIAVGRREALGLSMQGASASPVNYSRIAIDDFGEATIVPGRVATDLRCDVLMARYEAGTVKRTIDRLAGRPCVFSLSDHPLDDYLTTMGLATADVISDGPAHAKLSLSVRGLV